VRSSAYGSRFRVQGLKSGNVDPMRATVVTIDKPLRISISHLVQKEITVDMYSDDEC
jgi:hypothetical protein